VPSSWSRFTIDVDGVVLGVQSGEELVRGVQQRQRLQISILPLAQHRHLAGRLRLAQRRSGAPRQVERGLQPRLGEHRPTSFAIDDTQHPIRVRLVELGLEPIEQGQRRFGVGLRIVVQAAGQMDLGVIEEAFALQVQVFDLLGERVALAEVLVGGIPQLPVGVHHSDIVVRARATVRIRGGFVSLQRALIVGQGALVVALDVVKDAEVLRDPRKQGRIVGSGGERALVELSRLVDFTGLEGHPGAGVQRLRDQEFVAELGRQLLARVAKRAGEQRLVTTVMQHA
jgi:hypothetical protein